MDQPTEGRSSYDDEINLHDLWKVVSERKKLIIGIFLISVIAAAVISFLMPKVYRGDSILQIESKDISTKADIISAQEVVDIIGRFDREKIKALCPEN